MTASERELESLVRSVLQDIPAMPDRILAEALARVSATPQRRDRWARPWSPTGARTLAGHGTRQLVFVALLLMSLLALAAAAIVGAGLLLAPPAPLPAARGVFTDAGNLPNGNWAYGTATRLRDGRVLLLGQGGQPSSMLAESWDPDTGSLSRLESFVGDTRESHTATLLPDGRVLVAGGLHGGYADGSIASAVIWDPSTEAFTPTGSLTTARSRHVAALLPDGRVLLIGGDDQLIDGQDQLISGEIWDPATGTSSALHPQSSLIRLTAAVVLADGRVLVLGEPASGDGCAELWDISGTSGVTIESRPHGCGATSATLLRDGRVLVMGYADVYAYWTEVWDVASGSVTPTGAAASGPAALTPTLLADGRVLFVGGVSVDGRNVPLAELWDPATMAFSDTGSPLHALVGPLTVLLADGRVLVAAGVGFNYDAATQSFEYGAASWSEVFTLR